MDDGMGDVGHFGGVKGAARITLGTWKAVLAWVRSCQAEGAAMHRYNPFIPQPDVVW